MVSNPCTKVLVGTGDRTTEFNIPGALLTDCSTYFTGALNGGFREADENKIVLDDEDPEVFRTFVAWMYKQRLSNKPLRTASKEDFQSHLVRVYAFADKRGIPCLCDAVITALANHLHDSYLDSSIISLTYELGLEKSRLFRLFVDDEVGRHWEGHYAYEEYPKEFVAAVLTRSRAHMNKQEIHTRPVHPTHYVCDYHEHDKGAFCRNRKSE